jgi:hypothetical protein
MMDWGHDENEPRVNTTRLRQLFIVALYVAIVSSAVLLFFLIDKHGRTLTAAVQAQAVSHRAAQGEQSPNALVHVLGALLALLVLNVGLDRGVISPTLFAMMVFMALATTMATSPALNLLLKQSDAGGNNRRGELAKLPLQSVSTAT